MKNLRMLLTGFAGLLLLLLISCSSAKKEVHFVKVKNGNFEINGKAYHFIGTNMWYACYLGSEKIKGGRERLVRELDKLKSIGVNNIRILAAAEETKLIKALPLALQKSPGVYNEDLLDGLDFVLSEMSKRDMKAVLFLNNYWQWSGGMAQYNSWTSKTEIPDPDKTNNWGAFMNYSATFYANKAAQEAYRKHINMLVNRINKFSKVAYKDDATIMTWQLSNEPRPGTDSPEGEKNMDIFVKWIDETAAFIHSIAPNQLVSTGSEGTVGCLQNEAHFLRVHASKNIDYLNCHLWAKNWGWFKADSIDKTYPTSETKAIAYLNLHIKLARQMNKPLTMEEFGLDRDMYKLSPNTATTARDKYYSKLFELALDSAAKGAPIAGLNFWAWGGEGKSDSLVMKNLNSANMLGDPLCEPQGINSVYCSDESTLKIISEYAKKMGQLER